MDRLKGIEYYRRIYELGSFTATAEEFACSNAVISKYVKYLEAWTGVKLILRNTRTIRFTDEGDRFYDYCRSVLEQTDQLLDGVSDSTVLSGQLVIASPVSLSLKVLAPLIFQFQQGHPELSVRLRMSDHQDDLVGAGVDLAIRGIESPQDSSLVAMRLGDLERILVASPAYLDQAGHPESIRALADHRCLIYSLSSDAVRWEFTGPDQGEPVAVEVSGNLEADNSLLLVEAAIAGQGIALVPRSYVAGELASGVLRELVLDGRPVPRAIFGIYSDRRYLPARARRFLEFLQARL